MLDVYRNSRVEFHQRAWFRIVSIVDIRLVNSNNTQREQKVSFLKKESEIEDDRTRKKGSGSLVYGKAR